jgi:hypothetical protein
LKPLRRQLVFIAISYLAAGERERGCRLDMVNR